MSEHTPNRVEIVAPSGICPEWAEHELRFTQVFDSKHSSSNVIFLTTDELKLLFRVAADRISKTVPIGKPPLTEADIGTVGADMTDAEIDAFIEAITERP